MKTLDIPFFSQLDSSVPTEHQRHVCALACIKMIFDWKNKGIDFETIYQEAKIIGNQVEAGWTHETIIRLLRNHEVLAYRQEFLGHAINFETRKGEVAGHTKEFVEKGIIKIKKSIDEGNPVFVSVKANFSQNKEDHVVLVIGYTETDFIFHDPILNSEKTPLVYSIETFKTFWKNFAIFVE
jgi:uncharacterized protein YvpB